MYTPQKVLVLNPYFVNRVSPTEEESEEEETEEDKEVDPCTDNPVRLILMTLLLLLLIFTKTK